MGQPVPKKDAFTQEINRIIENTKRHVRFAKMDCSDLKLGNTDVGAAQQRMDSQLADALDQLDSLKRWVNG